MATAIVLPSVNPFLIDLLIDKLFKYLTPKDIINLRGVCKLWQQIGMRSLKKAIDAITISFDIDEPEDNPIEKFLEMAKGFSIKFINFRIIYSNDGSNDDANQKITQQTIRLLEEYGTHMKEIELNLCGTTSSWKFLSDVLVNKAPNVERLRLQSYSQTPGTTDKRLFSEKKKPELKLTHLSLFSENEDDEPIFSQTLLTDLFATSPNLRHLTVELDSENEINEVNNEALVVLQTLVDKGNISNLKELSLSAADCDIFQILATCFKHSPFEKFWIQIYQMDLPMLAYLETILFDHKDTLRGLYFTLPCVEFVNELTFPTLNNLQILYIDDWCAYENELEEHRAPLGAFDFGKQFPNLLTLHICEEIKCVERPYFNLDEMFPEETTPLLTLKYLKLPPISEPAILRRMGRIFPNVLKLNVVPKTPHVLSEVWTTWPEIKTLLIALIPYPSYRSSNLDSVFTGVTGSDRSRKGPSISDLRKLRYLRIDEGAYLFHSANETDLKIKDETASLALAKMEDLIFLEIARNCHQISRPCVQNLLGELNMLEAKNTESLRLVKYEWQKQSNSINYELSNLE